MNLDMQEIFNKAYRGLRAQGFERSIGADIACNGAALPRCLYNGPDGKHCAIGWVWSIDPKYENRSVWQLPMVDDGLIGFLIKLQKAHDGDPDEKYTNQEMKKALEQVASEYQIQIPPDDGKDPVLVAG